MTYTYKMLSQEELKAMRIKRGLEMLNDLNRLLNEPTSDLREDKCGIPITEQNALDMADCFDIWLDKICRDCNGREYRK